MDKHKKFQQGWDFMAQAIELGTLSDAAESAKTHSLISLENEKIHLINQTIDEFTDAINNHTYRNIDPAQFKGFAAEEWHAYTYNIDAITNESQNRAAVLHSNAVDSVDIKTSNGQDYSLKYRVSSERSVIEQARISQISQEPAYHGMERLIPSDQLDEGKKIANRKILENTVTRPKTANAYAETAEHLTDRVTDNEGNESIPLSLKNAEKIAKDGNKGCFNPEDYSILKQEELYVDIARSCIKAGLTSAAATTIFKLLPELFKVTDYLIKNRKLDILQLKKTGKLILTTSIESFLRGSTAYLFEYAIYKGIFGDSLKIVDPVIIGIMTAITISAFKSMIGYTLKKFDFSKLKNNIIDTMVTAVSCLGIIKISNLTGITSNFFPGASFLLGGLLSCSILSIYHSTNQKAVSFREKSGFIFFDLVDPDYEISDDALKKIGNDSILYPPLDCPNSLNTYGYGWDPYKIQESEYETIRFDIIRKGVFSVAPAQ